MSIVRKALGLPERRSGEGDPFSDPRWWTDIGGGNTTASGRVMSPQTALAIAAFYQGVRLISETFGSASCKLYRRLDGGGREEATDEPLYWRLKQTPNQENHAFGFFETLTGHAAVGGNAYSLMKRSRGDVTFKIVMPEDVTIKRVDGHLVYVVSDPVTFQRSAHTLGDDLMHFHMFGRDGITGISPIQLHRETLGEALDQREYGSKLYKNGTHAKSVLETESRMDKNQLKEMADQWQANWGGAENAGKTPILHSGIKLKGATLSPVDIAYIESKKMTILDISRILNIPVVFLNDLDRAIFSNMTELARYLVMFTLRPWAERWEATIERDVLTAAQRRAGLFVKFNLDALLRGSSKEEADTFKIYLDAGVVSINEVRELKEWNAVEGGDVHRVPLNMTDLNGNQQEKQAVKRSETSIKEVNSEPKTSTTDTKPVQNRAEKALYAVLGDAFQRIAAKEAQAVAKSAEKMRAQDFEKWLGVFYREHRDYAGKQVLPIAFRVAEGLSELTSDERTEINSRFERLLDRYIEKSISEIRDLLPSDGGDARGVWIEFVKTIRSGTEEWSQGHATTLTDEGWLTIKEIAPNGQG